MSPTAEREVDRLIHSVDAADLNRRLTRLKSRLDRLNGEDVEQRIDRLAARIKALLPLSPEDRLRIVKRFQRQERPGFAHARKDMPLLEMPPSGTGITDLDTGAMAVQCVISTPTRDRIGDILDPRGCILDEYRTNPVVLWAHDDEAFPVAKAEDTAGRCTVQIEQNRVTAVAYFIRGNARSEECFDLIRRRFLRGVSVGFQPDAEPLALPGGGNRYTRWVLYEFSFCSIPMNPETLVLSAGAEAF